MRYISKTIIICLLVVSALQPFPTMVSAQGESWLTGWDFRKSHDITGASGAGSDYQIMIITEYGEGEDSGNTVYLGGFSQTDFDDIRFTGADGMTLLDFWCEDYTVSDKATFWVEVQDSLSTDNKIYIYWGNATVSTTSNGYNTFIDFADFRFFMDTKNWYRGAVNERVHLEKLSEVPASIPNEQQGLHFDGANYWVTGENSSNGAFLYKLDLNGDYIDSVNITDDLGDLDGNYDKSHAGGMVYREGYFWIPVTETGAGTPWVINSAGVIARYDKNLDLIDIFLTLENGTEQPDYFSAGGSVVYFNDVMFIPRAGYLNPSLDYSYFVYNMTDKSFIGEVVETSDPSISLAQDFAYLDRGTTGINALPMQDMCVYTVRNYQTESVLMVAKPNATGTGLEMWGELKMDGAYGANGIDAYGGNIYIPDTTANYPDLYKMNGFVNLTCEIAINNHYIRGLSKIGPNVSMSAKISVSGQRKFNLGFADSWPSVNPQLINHGSFGDMFIYEGTADSVDNLTIESDSWTWVDLNWIDGYAELYNETDYITLTDGDISDTSLYVGFNTWGSADAPLYVQKVYVRKWLSTEPSHSDWGLLEDGPTTWETVGLIEIIFSVGWSPEFQFGYDAFFIFLGLIMIPASTMYLVRGGRKGMNADKFFYGIVIFALGIGFLIGGIMP